MKLSKEDVGRRYATAFYEYAAEHNVLDEVVSEFNLLKEVVLTNPVFISTMANPILNQSEKQTILESVKSKFSKTSQQYLQIIFDYQRFTDLAEILSAFNEKYEQENKHAHGTVTTAVTMTSDQIESLSKAYAKAQGLEKIDLVNKVDESILGGAILTINNTVIDGSIKTKLATLRANLVNKL